MRPLFTLLCLIPFLNSSAQIEFEHDGLVRTYFMDAPDPIPPGAPIVLVLHGYTSSAALIRTYSNWGDLAEEEGFVAVFPQGTQDNFGVNHWNANTNSSDTDDHSFLVALVQSLQAEYNLSPECTYSCGMSNGGFMSYSLACEHPDVFSAIGSVTGVMSAADEGCIPSEVVPVVHLHGTMDSIVPYEGSDINPLGGMDVPDVIEHWTGLMGTTTIEETPLPNQELIDLTSVDFIRYAGAPGGQEFHHYRVNGGGHAWFGAWGSQDVESTDVIWDFFSAQCAGGANAVASMHLPEPAIFQLSDGQLNVLEACSIRALNVLGQTAHSWPDFKAGDRINASEIKGHFLLHATTKNGRQQVMRIR